jgi:hypothetical protein
MHYEYLPTYTLEEQIDYAYEPVDHNVWAGHFVSYT